MAQTIRLAPGLAMRKDENGEIVVFQKPTIPATLPAGNIEPPTVDAEPEGDIEVTDPALLAQLNDSQELEPSTGDIEVTDPALLTQLSKPLTMESTRVNPLESAKAAAMNTINQVGRQAGLTARYGLEGVAAVPAVLANALNAVPDIPGTARQRFPEQNQAFSDLLTKVGFPTPETPTENIVGDITRAATGTGGIIKGAASKLGGAIMPNVAPILAEKPAVQLGAAIGSAGASSGAKEAGFEDVGQVTAGLAGGLAGGLVGGLGTPKTKLLPNALFEDIAEKGVDEVGAFQALRNKLGNEAAKLQEEISGKFVNGKKVEPGLFDIAKARGKNVFINKDIVDDLASDFRQRAVNEIDDEAKKIYINAANRLSSIEPISAGGKVVPINQQTTSLNDLEGLRRAASKISSLEGSKGFAGSDITREIDKTLEKALEKGATGDTAAIEIWQKAVSKRRDFGNKFERPTEIAAAIERNPARKSELLHTTETVQKKFLGSGAVSGKTELGRIYEDTLAALPKEQRPEAGFLLRQSVINHMVKRAIQTSDSPESVSAVFMANQIRGLRQQNKALWDVFSNYEKRTLNQMEKSLRHKTEGNFFNKTYNFLRKLRGAASLSGVEFPRTIKPKTIITVEDLIALTDEQPKLTRKLPISMGTTSGIQSTTREDE